MKRKIVILGLVCILSLIGCSNTTSVSDNNKAVVETTDIEEVEIPKELTEEDINKNVKNLICRIDDFDEMNFYYSKNTMEYSERLDKYYYNCMNGVYFYLVQKDNKVSLKAVFKYTGDNWIFYDNIVVKTGNKKYEIPIVESDIKRDVGDGGTVLEKYECVATQDIIDIANEILSNQDGKIRFSGEKTFTADLSAKDRNAIREVIYAYENIMSTIE